MQKIIMDKRGIERAVVRMAHQILEGNNGADDLVFIGIHTGGVPLARRLAMQVRHIEAKDVPIGSLDITLYRDDWTRLGHIPTVKRTDIPFSTDEKGVVLIDDVLFTGRTVRAALDAISDFGRPRRIQLAVLIDRGLRELPIQPDFVGLRLDSSYDEHIDVLLKETAGRDEVILKRKAL